MEGAGVAVEAAAVAAVPCRRGRRIASPSRSAAAIGAVPCRRGSGPDAGSRDGSSADAPATRLAELAPAHKGGRASPQLGLDRVAT